MANRIKLQLSLIASSMHRSIGNAFKYQTTKTLNIQTWKLFFVKQIKRLHTWKDPRLN